MSPGFAYVQARVQARFGHLADDTLCHRLAADRGLSSFLEEARGTPLAHWLAGFSRFSDTHHMEQGLRLRFHELVEETAEWVPEAWREAVTWVDWLPELPLIRYLLRGDPAPQWTLAAPLLGPHLKQADSDIRQALKRAGAAALLPRAAQPRSLGQRWVSHWRTLWPDCSGPEREGLEQLITLTHRHGVAFAAAPPDQGWAQRAELRAKLRKLFRHSALQPTALFAYLALAATELERLRGTLAQRAAYSELRRAAYSGEPV